MLNQGVSDQVSLMQLICKFHDNIDLVWTKEKNVITIGFEFYNWRDLDITLNKRSESAWRATGISFCLIKMIMNIIISMASNSFSVVLRYRRDNFNIVVLVALLKHKNGCRIKNSLMGNDLFCPIRSVNLV